jgi:cytochrome c
MSGARYSRAMQDSGVVWAERTLDAYLADPRGFTHGTTMIVGAPNATDHADLIAYIKTLTMQ